MKPLSEEEWSEKGGMKVFSTFSGIGGFERGLEQAWKSVTSARNQESFIKEGESVRSVSESTSLNGGSTTSNTAVPLAEDITPSENNESSICTDQSAPVAERLSRSSSLSNTETTTAILTENSTEQGIATSLLSKNINQKNTRSSATTATTQKEGTESAPICVGYSEIDKYARSVYEYHFPNTPNFGDITKINEKELPDFDCLVGGFPCQAFSIAGKRGGFDDTRGTLFFDLARILREKQPRLFVFENVKGLLSHDQGRTFSTIITTIDELGYDCQWQVLNSKNFGVPQNRERVIIVGHLRGTPRPEVFPIGRSSGKVNSEKSNVYLGQAQRVRNINGVSQTLSGLGGGQGAKTGIYEVGQDPIRVRRLTPLECERLQAFPDNWTKYGKDNEPISDTQRYKMCGNAVTVNVVEAVFRRLLDGTENTTVGKTV